MFTVHVTKMRWHLSLLWNNNVKEPNAKKPFHMFKNKALNQHTQMCFYVN